MSKLRYLVTSGCSFTETKTGMQTWAAWLAKHYKLELHNQGTGSQGNQHISRKLIYQTNQLLLQGIDPEQIICVAMWSGPNRTEYYNPNPPDYYPEGEGHEVNPDRFVPNDRGGWIIQNSHWVSCQPWYRNWESIESGQIRLYESIIHAQSWCDAQGITLVHGLFKKDVVTPEDPVNPATSWMVDIVNQYKWLPWACFDWCDSKHCELKFPNPRDWHPSRLQHKLYTERVIVPYMDKILCTV